MQHVTTFKEADDLAVDKLVHLKSVFTLDQQTFAFEAGSHEATFGYALMERHCEFLFVEAVVEHECGQQEHHVAFRNFDFVHVDDFKRGDAEGFTVEIADGLKPDEDGDGKVAFGDVRQLLEVALLQVGLRLFFVAKEFFEGAGVALGVTGHEFESVTGGSMAFENRLTNLIAVELPNIMDMAKVLARTAHFFEKVPGVAGGGNDPE